MVAKGKIITIECILDDVNELTENTLGERVRKLRLENNLNIKQLASKSNISEVSISKIEKDKSIPYITTINKLSNTLNTSNKYLLNLDNLPEDTPGDIIYKYRLMKGLSQRALAKLCNLHQSTIKDYENNKISNPETLEIIFLNIAYKLPYI